MKLTTKSEYSLLALLYIGRHSQKIPVKLHDICSTYTIPPKYLEQLLYLLKNDRYIKTKRGKQGGYQLAKPPQLITIAEIVRLMDGPLAAPESVSTYYYTPTSLEKEKKLLHIFKEIRDYTAVRLENQTIADFL